MKDKGLSFVVSFNDHYLAVRVLLTAFVGVVIAGLLTLFMHILIEFSQQELIDSPRVNMLDFVRVKRDETSQRKKVQPKRPENQKAPPAPPTPQNNDQSLSDSALQVAAPTISTEVNVDLGTGISTSDGEYLPIVKVAPAYPARAALNGLEGTCLVEFTVTTTGSTKDVKPVEGYCLGIFVKASVTAAKKFKYKPRVVDGKPIEVPGIRNQFDFVLDKQKQ